MQNLPFPLHRTIDELDRAEIAAAGIEFVSRAKQLAVPRYRPG